MSEECTHDCSSCSANCEARDKKSFLEKLNEHSSVKHIIGIVSGKVQTKRKQLYRAMHEAKPDLPYQSYS
jgi:hypothetical protein